MTKNGVNNYVQHCRCTSQIAVLLLLLCYISISHALPRQRQTVESTLGPLETIAARLSSNLQGPSTSKPTPTIEQELLNPTLSLRTLTVAEGVQKSFEGLQPSTRNLPASLETQEAPLAVPGVDEALTMPMEAISEPGSQEPLLGSQTLDLASSQGKDHSGSQIVGPTKQSQTLGAAMSDTTASVSQLPDDAAQRQAPNVCDGKTFGTYIKDPADPACFYVCTFSGSFTPTPVRNCCPQGTCFAATTCTICATSTPSPGCVM